MQPVENARIVCDNVCFGFDGVFRLTGFGTCQYEVATCGKAENCYRFTRFGRICANPTKKKGFFAKAQFFLTKTRFLTGPTIFWVFEALGGSL